VSALIRDSSSVLMRQLSTGFVPVVLGYSCLVLTELLSVSKTTVQDRSLEARNT
jgi:hypothetical protein